MNIRIIFDRRRYSEINKKHRLSNNFRVRLGGLILLILSSVNIFADINFPKPTGFVNDYADILTDAEENILTEIAEGLEREATAEVAVVTVNTVQPLTIEEYSVRLFEEWGIGKKGKDNGVLVLVAVEDRAVKIEVGYGLEGVLPDGRCGEIIRGYIIPEFKSARYGAGIIAGVNEISSALGGKQIPQVSPETVGGIKDVVHSFMTFIFILIFVAIAILQAFLPRRRYWSTWGGSGSWGGSGGSSFGGGGFGGFGGGRSGGGGAVGRW